MKTYRIEFELQFNPKDHPFDHFIVQKLMECVRLPEVTGWDMLEVFEDGTEKGVFQSVYDRHMKKDSEKI